MADPSACRYFRPARNDFYSGNEKKSHEARSGKYGGGGETKKLPFLSSKTP